ncbi:thyroid receptor-interacting protein 11 isoform X1 [Drosophila bipectinata]|uniref:thyroid receptor-interacting protein 11 isoform X1 n=2 Tax=Drosophila bipectinata TaxID=42026 RepID=UPI001C8A25AB|nr:trichohyalin [Drosophila bipectinata]
MSWLNNSLTSLKGQLTNLAQEVLAETAGPGDPDFQGGQDQAKTALDLLAETQQQKEQLDIRCEQKDREIAALRREVAKLKSQNEGAVKSSPSNTSSKEAQPQNEDQNVEDSWCWEPVASEGGKPSPVTGGAAGSGDSGLVDIALGTQDVTRLNSRISELEELNQQLNASLEELDSQHELAMQDVLKHKTELTSQVAQLKQIQADRLVEHELAQARQQKQLEELRQVAATAKSLQEELQQRVSQQEEELKRSITELAEMQVLVEKRGQDNAELIERIRQADAEKEKLIKEVEELRLTKEKKTSESSSQSSSTGKHSEDEFIVVRQTDAGSEPDPEVTPPPSKEKLRDRLVSLEAQISELALTNSQLQDGQLEKQLSINLLGEQLVELEKRLHLSEAEKEQLQLDLQLRLQQLTVQNQELKLHAEAEQEGHAQDLEEQLGTLREENSRLRQEIDASIAQAKFRQAIAEEKQEITDLDEAESEDSAFDLEKLRSLLQAELEDRLESSQPQQVLERAWSSLRSRWHRLDVVEQRLAELQDQQLVTEHEKKTLEADISQYILQCDELMKNNELLLNELDKFKRNKLETIEEHHEETIVQLEGQLEDARLRLEVALQAQRELQEELSRESSEPDSSELKELLAATKAKLEKAEAKLAENLNLEEILTNTKLELDRQSNLREKAEQELEELPSLRQELEAKVSQQKSLVEQHKNHLAKLQEKIQEDQEKIRELLLQQDKLDQQKELMEVEQNQQLSTMKKELLSTASQLQDCQEKLNQREVQLSELQEQLKDITEEKAKLEELLQNSGGDSPQVQELQKQLEEIQQKEQQWLKDSQTQQQVQQSVEALGQEKQELIKALQQKHLENTQYYAEIQRLQPVELQLKELTKEREKLQDQIAFLKEKSDILTTNLLTEQTNQRLLQQQQQEAQEQQATVMRDLERLRAHLLEVEDLHTQETVELQYELEQCRSRQAVLEQEASKSSTAYTSASIRANQQAETLQAQHVLLQQQRDELLTKLGQLEDRELKQQAALTNLQCALEQFQNDKEHDIEMATQRIRREMQSQLDRQDVLQAEIVALKQQLADANQGLRAAARLSDQLEAGQQTIAVLRDEVESLKDTNGQLETRLNSSESSQTDKIDKSLIKSLLIGYVVSGHAGDKQQVLRMISSVLDFSAQESDKVGLNKQQSSWLGSILGGGSSSTAGSGSGNDNLVQAFVQFLEQESQPQANLQSRPTLLSMSGQVEAAASTPPAALPLPAPASSGPERSDEATTTLAVGSSEFAPSRNSSSILKDILSDS